MTVKELHEIVKEFKGDFQTFRSNEFFHLEKKVDRNSWLLAIGVGIIATLQLVLHFVK